MSKRRMSFDKEEASNPREGKLARRNPNQQEAPIPANPNPEEGEADPNPEEEAPIQEEGDADPNPEEEGDAEEEDPIPANPNQDLLFEKKLTKSEATSSGSQLRITGGHRETLMAFLTDAERQILAEDGGALMVGTRIANGNGVEYALELKRDKKTYFNGWAEVARANRVRSGDSVQGFGSRVAGEFQLLLHIVKKSY